jgi:ferredoxin
VLVGGLLATALSSAAVWLLILPYAALGAGVHLYVAGAAAGSLFAVVGFWMAVDVLVAPGLFCKNLCPTGFLLGHVGRFSWLRVAKRPDAAPCPTGCRVCQQTCPYALLPRDDTHVPSCDACGRCVSACPGGRLQRQILLPIIGMLVFAWLPGPASAHHNKGMPHYGYFENYAQVPSEEYLTIQGRWEMGATLFNFQGLDRRTADTPNDVKIYIYLYDRDAGRGWEERVEFSILLDGESIATFVREHVDEESVYSTRETVPRSGDYELVAHVDGDHVVLPFHVDLASDGVRWGLILALTVPALGIFSLAFYGRSRRRRPRVRKTLDMNMRSGRT